MRLCPVMTGQQSQPRSDQVSGVQVGSGEMRVSGVVKCWRGQVLMRSGEMRSGL
jgi:hypothetical protein